MSKHSFWSGFGIATSACIAGGATVICALSALGGMAVSPSEVGHGDSIYIIPFQMLAALLAGLLELVAIGCGAVAVSFTIIGIVTYREMRKTQRTLQLMELMRSQEQHGALS